MDHTMEERWIWDASAKIAEKMAWVSEKSKDKIPYTTINGTHDDRSGNTPGDDGINWWTNGFFSGMMWLMYQKTGRKSYAEIARHTEEKLDQCFEMYYGLHHDVGFMWLLSAVADYRLTKDVEARRRALHAANLLAGRFNPAGRFIRAWNGVPDEKNDNRGWAIIDSMMNMPLLYWASEETKDPRFKQIALLHADTVLENFVREDGSVKHIVEFDPESGTMVTDHGGQGYAKGSSWTRGQAWGIYGFVLNYIHTGKREYLQASEKIAAFFMAHIPENGLIPIDFDQPGEPGWKDSTAAAIAASGLLTLAEECGKDKREGYREAALKLLRALVETDCDFTKEDDCILHKGSVAYHVKEHHQAIIYGDYFFMEAICKLTGTDLLLW